MGYARSRALMAAARLSWRTRLVTGEGLRGVLVEGMRGDQGGRPIVCCGVVAILGWGSKSARGGSL